MNDPRVRFKAVHLNQELVEGLFALIVPAAEPGPASPTHRIDLVNEEDAGRVLLALRKEVANARGTDAHEHLYEVGSGHREERHIGFARNRARQQRLACARAAHQKYSLGNAATETRELFRVLKKGDNFFDLLARFLDAGDVLEGDLALLFGQKLRCGLSKAHEPATAILTAANEVENQPHQQEHGQPRNQKLLPERVVVHGLDRPLYVVGRERSGNVIASTIVRPNNHHSLRAACGMQRVPGCAIAQGLHDNPFNGIRAFGRIEKREHLRNVLVVVTVGLGRLHINHVGGDEREDRQSPHQKCLSKALQIFTPISRIDGIGSKHRGRRPRIEATFASGRRAREPNVLLLISMRFILAQSGECADLPSNTGRKRG